VCFRKQRATPSAFAETVLHRQQKRLKQVLEHRALGCGDERLGRHPGHQLDLRIQTMQLLAVDFDLRFVIQFAGMLLLQGVGRNGADARVDAVQVANDGKMT
jgi:hypothetical protein